MKNYGEIISVRGSVVDVCFENNLPPIYTLLHTGENNEVDIEVLSQLVEQTGRSESPFNTIISQRLVSQANPSG